jgi:hypothetical protein
MKFRRIAIFVLAGGGVYLALLIENLSLYWTPPVCTMKRAQERLGVKLVDLPLVIPIGTVVV